MMKRSWFRWGVLPSGPHHVDYLSVRPDPDRVLPKDDVNPVLKK